jgi:hypothetical protein
VADRISVQQHFNDIEMRIRNLAVTMFAATVSAAAFTQQSGWEVDIPVVSFSVPMAMLIILVGAIAWIAFYLMDQYWYHVFLKATAAHARFIETRAFLQVLALCPRHPATVDRELSSGAVAAAMDDATSRCPAPIAADSSDMKLLKGMRRTPSGFQAYVRVYGRLLTKRFPATATITEMKDWREAQRWTCAVAASAPRAAPFASEVERYLCAVSAMPPSTIASAILKRGCRRWSPTSPNNHLRRNPRAVADLASPGETSCRCPAQRNMAPVVGKQL